MDAPSPGSRRAQFAPDAAAPWGYLRYHRPRSVWRTNTVRWLARSVHSAFPNAVMLHACHADPWWRGEPLWTETAQGADKIASMLAKHGHLFEEEALRKPRRESSSLLRVSESSLSPRVTNSCRTPSPQRRPMVIWSWPRPTCPVVIRRLAGIRGAAAGQGSSCAPRPVRARTPSDSRPRYLRGRGRAGSRLLCSVRQTVESAGGPAYDQNPMGTSPHRQ